MKNAGLNHIPPVKGHVVNLTINLICIAIFYVFFGAFVSKCMSMLFPPFDDEWKKQSNLYQMADVSIEISLLVIVAFWLTYIVNVYVPIMPVSSGLESYIESFGGQTVFVYAVFIFMGTLDDKLKEVFSDIFG